MSADDVDPGQETQGMSKAVKVGRTLVMVAAWLCMGLYSEVSGPTLPYLKSRVDSDYEEISRVLVARSVGFLLGSIAGGVLCQRYCKFIDLWMALSLTLAAVATVVVPWCRHLGVLAIMFAMDGTGKGILAAGGNSFILTLWGGQASAPCHSLHFAFGVGALIVPQIARPFLPELPTSANTTVQVNGLNPSDVITASLPAGYSATNQSEPLEEVGGATIEYPYCIVGGITMLCALAFMVLYWCVPLKGDIVGDRKQPPLRKMIDPSTCVPGSTAFAIQFLLLLCVLFALPVGAERAFGKFIFAYSVEGSAKFSKDDGTLLETVFWGSFTAGRGVSTLLAKWVPAVILLVLEIVLSLLATILLATLGGSQPIVLWLSTALFAASLSPVFPTVLSWANLRIKLTPMVTSLAFIAAACGAFVFSWLSGFLFQKVGPPSLMYLVLAYTIALAAIFAVCYCFARTYGGTSLEGDVLEDIKDQDHPEMEALKDNPKEKQDIDV